MQCELVSQLIFACACSKGSIIWARNRTPPSKVCNPNDVGQARCCGAGLGDPFLSLMRPHRRATPAAIFCATDCVRAASAGGGRMRPRSGIDCKSPSQQVCEEIQRADIFTHLLGGSRILLHWRLSLQWEATPYALPPSRSPLWPSVCRTGHPEECHILPAPPHNSSELEAGRQTSNSMVSGLVSSHKGLQLLPLLLD